MHFLFYYFGRVLDTIDSVHGVDEDFKQVVHVLVVGDNKIDLTMLQLQCQTLPRIKWHLFIC